MGVLERHGWEKEVARRKRKLSESVEIVDSTKTSVLSFSNMAEYSKSRGNLNRCDDRFLLNENGDLYFLLHKNIVNFSLKIG